MAWSSPSLCTWEEQSKLLISLDILQKKKKTARGIQVIYSMCDDAWALDK